VTINLQPSSDKLDSYVFMKEQEIPIESHIAADCFRREMERV